MSSLETELGSGSWNRTRDRPLARPTLGLASRHQALDFDKSFCRPSTLHRRRRSRRRWSRRRRRCRRCRRCSEVRPRWSTTSTTLGSNDVPFWRSRFRNDNISIFFLFSLTFLFLTLLLSIEVNKLLYVTPHGMDEVLFCWKTNSKRPHVRQLLLEDCSNFWIFIQIDDSKSIKTSSETLVLMGHLSFIL